MPSHHWFLGGGLNYSPLHIHRISSPSQVRLNITLWPLKETFNTMQRPLQKHSKTVYLRLFFRIFEDSFKITVRFFKWFQDQFKDKFKGDFKLTKLNFCFFPGLPTPPSPMLITVFFLHFGHAFLLSNFYHDFWQKWVLKILGKTPLRPPKNRKIKKKNIKATPHDPP